MSLFLVATPRQTNAAQFVVSATNWSYPDQYGQGIERIYYQIRFPNETVSEWAYLYPSNTTWTFDVPVNGTVYLRTTAWVNGTLTGASSVAEAHGYARYDLNVYNAQTNVHTQQNLTADGGDNALAPMYKIYDIVYISGHHVSANPKMTNGFVAGQIYTVILNYEIYYITGA